MLQPFTPNGSAQFPAREPPRPPPVVPEDNQWIVDRIIDHKGRGRAQKFLVSWEGFPESDNEWVAEKDVQKSLVEEYFERIGDSECVGDYVKHFGPLDTWCPLLRESLQHHPFFIFFP